MDLPWSYADAIAERMFGVERLAFLKNDPTKLRAVMVALIKRQQKVQGD